MSRLEGFKGWLTRAMPPSEDTCDSDRESIVVSAGVSAGGHAVHEVSASSGVPHTRNSTPTGGNAEVVLHSGIPALSQNNSNKSVSALVLELSAFEGKLRKARSTLQAGFHENKERQQNKHWGASSAHEGSPARSQSINSVNSSHLSESIHRLQTPGSMGSDPPWTEELIQELFQTSRRMEELETEVEEGARMLDVANVRLAEQLMLCTTVSAKLMWPADTPSNSVPGITSLPGNDAACSDDSFAVASDFRIPARGAVTPSDDPIESLSPSESGGVEQGELDLQQVIPFSPTADMDAFQQRPYSPAQQSTWLAFRPQREDSIQAPHLGGDLRTALYDRLGKYMFRQRKRIAGKRYLQHWHETCAWEIELRKALAQVEIGLQHRLLRRVVQGWWRGVQHECDWDCGFCGTPAKVAAHEQICDAMLLATAWKHDTTLSIRGSAVDADIFHHRLKGWLPHESSTGSHPSVFSATSKLRSWLPSVICQYEDDDQSESDRVECWTSMRSRLVLDRLIMMVRGTDEEAATMMQDSIENGSTDDAADQVAAVLARTSVIAVRRSLMGDGAEVASRFLQILDDFDKFRQTPEEQEELCGVGIRLTDHVPMAIADILPHGPAGKCGILRVGDIISKIDGYAVSNTRIDQCRSMIAGRKGTMVSFEFLRKVSDSGMKSLSVDLCRAPLELVSRANWVEKHPKARLLDSGTAKGSQDQTPQAKQDFIALHVSMIVQRIVLAAVFGREQALIEDRVKEMAERISVLESERDRDALNTMEVQTKLVEAQHELSLLRGTGSSPSLTSNLSSRRQSSAPHEQTTSSFTSLPPGWKQYWSKSKNKPYYKQKGISATFWRIPESEITHIAPGKPRATELEPLPETVEEGEVCGEAVAGFQSGRTELVQKWGCEFGCGFIGNFEEVSQHEASCRLIPKVEASWDEMNYLTQQVKTYQAKHSRMEQGCALLQQDLKQLESIVSTLKAGLKLSYQEAQEAKALAFKLETELEVSEVLLKSRQEELERIYELINAGNLEAIENSILESPTCELSLQTAPDPATLLQGETYSTQYVAEEIEKRQQQLMLEIESRQALERELLSLKTSHDESIHKYSLHARKLQERVDELETKLQNAPVFKDDSSPPTDTALGLSQETKWVHTFGCEFRCGFSGSFEDVSNHETNCSFRQETKHTSTGPIQDRDLQTALEQAIDREQALILQLSTLKAREEIFERDLSRLQAELEVSRAPVNKKDEETETNKVTSSGEADGLEHESFSVDMPPVLQNDYTQMKASLEIANVQMQTLGMELRLISSELSQMLPTSEDKGVKRGFDCWLEYLEVMAQERAVEAQERARQELSDSAKATRTKLDAERERRNEICKRVVQRMLWHQLSMAWNEFVHCVQTSRVKKATVFRVLGRMQHRQLAGAFDCYAGAVQSVATHREHLSKTVSRWRSPHVKRGFECWLEYLEVMAQERAVEAQERARQELSDSAKATRTKLDAERERRNEICKRVVQRMLWHQLSMAWNEFVHCVQTSRVKKATVFRVLGRMQHRQLAGAFDCYAGAVQSVATHREHLSKTVSRWRSPHVKRGFECWLEYLEVMAQERAVEAQERARQELSDSAKATRSKLKALQERNARWSSYAQRYLLKISVYKAFQFWKAEIRHLCCSNRQALCILNYIHNSMVRRAFQKWSYEMISTVFVRDKIYCADQKHAMELRLQIMTVWAHTCKANSLCKLKASRIRARCCNQQIFTAFLRWWHLLYWDTTARRLSTRFSKLRAVSCLQQWSARAKHHRERFMKVIRHKQRRRHQFQAESWQTWACLSSSQRLRNRSHMFCGRLQRRRRLSAVFARWMRFTAGRVRQILEQGWEESNRKPFHVVVCPPKRCILNHYVDLWTAGVSYRLKKQNKVKKACRCFRLCTSAQTLSRWQGRVAHNRLQRQKIYQLIKSHRLAELSAAMYRWLLAVCRSLPDLPHHIDDRLYKDSQLKASPMLLPVTSGQSTRSSPNYELAHGESALHSAVKPISPALSLGSASVFQKMTDDSHDGKAPSCWDTSSFTANTSAGIAFSSDDDSEDERPPLRVSDRARAWGRDWVVSLSAMRATPPAVPSSRSPEHRRSSSGHSRSQKSMDDKRALFGSRSGVPHRHPESPEGQNLAFNHYVSGTLPSAELRHRPIPCLRSSSKEKESVVLDFGRTETSSSQTTRASPHNAAKTPKTRSPDLTFLKQNLRRLYD